MVKILEKRQNNKLVLFKGINLEKCDEIDFIRSFYSKTSIF